MMFHELVTLILHKQVFYSFPEQYLLKKFRVAVATSEILRSKAKLKRVKLLKFNCKLIASYKVDKHIA